MALGKRRSFAFFSSLSERFTRVMPLRGAQGHDESERWHGEHILLSNKRIMSEECGAKYTLATSMPHRRDSLGL